jgi:hypothetical protein
MLSILVESVKNLWKNSKIKPIKINSAPQASRYQCRLLIWRRGDDTPLPQEKKPISRILSRSPFFKEQMNPVDGECLKE